MIIVDRIKKQHLSDLVKSFISSLEVLDEKSEKESLAIYWRKNDIFYFIEDLSVKFGKKAKAVFLKQAAKHDLYLAEIALSLVAPIKKDKANKKSKGAKKWALLRLLDESGQESDSFRFPVSFFGAFDYQQAVLPMIGKELFVKTKAKKLTVSIYPSNCRINLKQNQNGGKRHIANKQANGLVYIDNYRIEKNRPYLKVTMVWKLEYDKAYIVSSFKDCLKTHLPLANAYALDNGALLGQIYKDGFHERQSFLDGMEGIARMLR
jgi:hypothetical protein